MDPVDYLLGIVSAIISWISAVISFLLMFFQYVVEILYAYIVAVVQFLIAGFRILLSFLKSAVLDLLHGNFRALWDDWVKFRDALRAWLKPLRDALALQQRLWRLVYGQFIAPVLQFIQDLRKILVVFRLFHFHWATVLDNYLAGIEAKIIGAWSSVMRAINRHADLLMLLSDPLGFLRIVPLLHSVALAAEDIFRLFTHRTMAWTLGVGPTGKAGTLPTSTLRTWFDGYTQQLATGTGDAGAQADTFAALRTAFSAELGG
jgi:hypothetical protein